MNGRMIAVAAGFAAALAAGLAAGEPARESQGPDLGAIMMAAQNHHAKLWYAGNAGNWDLADYQIDELKDGFEDAVKLIPDYKGVPVGGMIDDLLMPPIAEVERAIKAQDRAKFTAAYDKLTAACNACHQGAKRGFIVIQRPVAAAFPNQSFAPKKK